jgi:hypothetical protein
VLYPTTEENAEEWRVWAAQVNALSACLEVRASGKIALEQELRIFQDLEQKIRNSRRLFEQYGEPPLAPPICPEVDQAKAVLARNQSTRDELEALCRKIRAFNEENLPIVWEALSRHDALYEWDHRLTMARCRYKMWREICTRCPKLPGGYTPTVNLPALDTWAAVSDPKTFKQLQQQTTAGEKLLSQCAPEIEPLANWLIQRARELPTPESLLQQLPEQSRDEDSDMRFARTWLCTTATNKYRKFSPLLARKVPWDTWRRPAQDGTLKIYEIFEYVCGMWKLQKKVISAAKM